nr:RNA-directed DNA polymerase, eukaryota [Tanacetum cinerariifolium]
MDKEASVATKLGSPSIDESFRRPVRDGVERFQWRDLYEVIDSVTLSSSNDRWVCDLSGDGEFRVKEVRFKLDYIFLPSSDAPTRWVNGILIKINIFVWLDRLPTRCNLVRRGVVLDSDLCPMCSMVSEDISHVLFRCNMAGHIFRLLCRWWDLEWQAVCSFSKWNDWFLNIRLSSKVNLLLKGVFYVSWWHLWVFMNQLIFDDSPPRQSVVFDDIVSRSFLWCSNRCNGSFSWESWLKNPYLISL